MRHLVAVVVTCAPALALACSPAPTSLLEKFTGASSVFVGRMEAVRPDGRYDLRVLEAFKGVAAEATVPTRLAIGTQCGFDEPKPGERYLVIARGDEPVTTASGSFVLWDEASAVALNPTEGTLATLRALVANERGRPPTPLVPNAQAAVHRALEVLVPLFGAHALAPHKPLTAVELPPRGSDEPAWRVTAGPLTVDVGKWSGGVKVTPLAKLLSAGPGDDAVRGATGKH